MSSTSARSKEQGEDATCYRIRLVGRIDEFWADHLGGMTVVEEAPGPDGAVVTTLAGCVPDQAALSGVLNFAHDLGLVLLSVERGEDGCDA